MRARSDGASPSPFPASRAWRSRHRPAPCRRQPARGADRGRPRRSRRRPASGAGEVRPLRPAQGRDRRRRQGRGVRLRQHGASAGAAIAGKSGPVVLFARNRLCALVRPGLAVDARDAARPHARSGSSSAPRRRRPIRPATTPSRCSQGRAAQARRAGRAGEEGAAAHRQCRPAPQPPPGRASTAGTSPRAGPTSSSPTAPLR